MDKIKAKQVLYTSGYAQLADGVEVTVADDHTGGDIVKVLTALKAIYFIPKSQLSTTKIMSSVSIPSWLRPVGATTLWAKRVVYVYNHATIPNGKTLAVADGYIHNDALSDVRCIDQQTKLAIVVPKANIYVQITTTTTYNKPEPKPLAKDCDTLTEDHKYMIELLQEPKRDGIIDKVMRGVKIEDYDIIKAPKYFVLVPKVPETLYMPMIMAHTDIVSSVKHPTENNLEYDPKLDKFTSPNGLGADDRAGCYAINKALVKHPNKFIIALFDEEEIGCLGSRAFANSQEFANINRMTSCYISIDRRRGNNGEHTIATYGYDNKELFDLVKLATGRSTVIGSSTDCKALSEKSYNLPQSPGQTKLACFNMSCGYENEHTAREGLYFTELQKVVEDLDALVDLAFDLWEQPFEATKKAEINHYGGKNKKWNTPEEIMIDGDSYDEMDVRNLLWLYQQFTGKSYKFVDVQRHVVDPELYQYARLNTDCAPNGTYGGVLLTKDMYDVLVSHTWVISKTQPKKLVCDLVSEDGKKTASNVPYAWIKIITINEPLIETKEK